MEIPRETPFDKGHAVVKGIVGSIPIVGSLTAEVVGLIWTRPIDKRRDEFFQEIVAILQDLQNREIVSFDRLKEIPEFSTYLTHTFQVFIKTHQKEKHQALKNALESYFENTSAEFDRKQMYLQLIDDLTPSHINILSHLQENESEIIVGRIMQMDKIHELLCLAGLKCEYQLFLKCVRDLERYVLIRVSKDMSDPFSGGGFSSDEGAPPIKVLPFAVEFLRYIKS